jgi:hypothetical protein
MFKVDTNIQIGDYEFAFCVDAEIVSTIDSLTDTCRVTIPRKFNWNGKNIALGDDPILKRKDKVIVQAGYDGKLSTQFIGYIKDIKPGVPLTIECEDGMMPLKTGEITGSYRSATLKQLLRDILPSTVEFVCPEIVLGPYRFTKVTVARILEDIHTRFGIYSYFRLITDNGNTRPVLYSGLAYWTDHRTEETFEFGYNIINHDDLVYKREEDVRLKIKAIGILPNNKRIELPVGDDDGEIRTVHYYNVDLPTLKLRAEQDLARFKYTGYVGSFLTFGEPSVQKGDIVNLVGNVYHPDGKYNRKALLTIKEIIQQLADNGDEIYGRVCTVKSVNGLICDCSPVNGDADILDVRLVADESEERFVLIPAVDSYVCVEFFTREAAYISMVSKVSEVMYKIGEAYYSVTSEGFLLQKGTDTLKQILQNIVEAVQQIVVVEGNNPDYVKLQTALTSINNLLR